MTNNYQAQVHNYTIDTVNEADVLNSQLTGPGPGADQLVATFRLAKWYDTFGDNGKPKAIYEPLYNAKFKLTVTDVNGDEKLLADMASGKEANPNYALAISGSFLLVPGENGVGKLRDYENEGGTREYDVNYTRSLDNITLADGSTKQVAVYKVPCVLREYEAPDGYSYSHRDYHVYLCFVDESPNSDTQTTFWYYSDAYFIKDKEWTEVDGVKVPVAENERTPLAANQSGTAYYATSTDKNNVFRSLGSDHYRIVDYPMDNTMVTLYKFGYTPSSANPKTTEKSSAELWEMYQENQLNIAMMNGVKMKIQHKKADGNWEDWNPVTNAPGSYDIEIFPDGTYVFSNGLPMGEYRIIETDLASWADRYENAYPDAAHAREFTVGGNECSGQHQDGKRHYECQWRSNHL